MIITIVLIGIIYGFLILHLQATMFKENAKIYERLVNLEVESREMCSGCAAVEQMGATLGNGVTCTIHGTKTGDSK